MKITWWGWLLIIILIYWWLKKRGKINGGIISTPYNPSSGGGANSTGGTNAAMLQTQCDQCTEELMVRNDIEHKAAYTECVNAYNCDTQFYTGLYFPD